MGRAVWLFESSADRSGILPDPALLQHQDGIVAMSINTKTNLFTVGSIDGDVGLYDIRSPGSVVRV